MPIDYNILFKQEAPDYAGSLVNGIESGLKLSDLIAKKKQNQKAEQDQADYDAAVKAGTKFENGKFVQDRGVTLSQLANNPSLGLETQSKFNQQDLANKEASQKQYLQNGAFLLNAADQAKSDPAMWPQIRAEVIKRGFAKPEEIPEQWDEKTIMSAVAPLRKHEDVLKNSLVAEQIAEKKADTAKTWAETGKIKTESKGGNFKAENDFRSELSKNPTIKDFQQISSSYRAIKDNLSSPTPSAAKDMSAIFQYMKILDPSSTVREGEYASAQNATGVPEQVLNMYNKAIKGEILNIDQRKDFLNAAGVRYKSQKQSAEQVFKNFEPVIKRQGVEPNNVYQSMDYSVPEEDQSNTGVVKASQNAIPKTVVQNGFVYKYNEKTGKYE